MGWGKCGKGGGLFHHHHHGGKGWFHHGPNPLLLGAEAALIGGATAAVVASTVARPRRRLRPAPVVFVSPPSVVPLTAQVAQPLPAQQIVYVSDGWKGKGKGGKGNRKGKGVLQVVAPLRISSIRLPHDSMEFRGDVNFFAIDVTPEDSAVPSPWRVMRRYNDFKALADRFGSQAYSFPDAPFPKKHTFGCTGVALENRRRGLEVWLQRAFEHPSSASVWIGPLRDFVGVDQASYTPAVSSAVVATSGPAAVPLIPSAPDSAALSTAPGSTTAQGPHSEECEVLELDVPPGVCAGQLLGVVVPDGRQLTLPLPEGAAAGDTLHVVYDPATDTLRLLDAA